MEPARWQFWIDRGGTFTDVVARTLEGALVTAKLLSEDPGRCPDAAVAAMRRLTGVAHGPLPPADIRIGTTIAANALLERRGEPTLPLVTRASPAPSGSISRARCSTRMAASSPTRRISPSIPA